MEIHLINSDSSEYEINSKVQFTKQTTNENKELHLNPPTTSTIANAIDTQVTPIISLEIDKPAEMKTNSKYSDQNSEKKNSISLLNRLNTAFLLIIIPFFMLLCKINFSLKMLFF